MLFFESIEISALSNMNDVQGKTFIPTEIAKRFRTIPSMGDEKKYVHSLLVVQEASF